jgi:hypothetical protein
LRELLSNTEPTYRSRYRREVTPTRYLRGSDGVVTDKYYDNLNREIEETVKKLCQPRLRELAPTVGESTDQKQNPIPT